MEYIAKTFQGLEEVLATELTNLGGQNIRILKRAVAFEGDKKLLYAANLRCRTAVRILQPIADAINQDEKALYKWASSVDWEKYIDENMTFALDVTAYSEVFRHANYALLTVKDAIVDQFRKRFGKRPSIDTENPDVRFQLQISGVSCRLLLDSSGSSLHLRNYRLEQGEAPINEVLAAGMVLLSGWDKKGIFIDPMCGAGTILAEAAMIAKNIAPNKLRTSFGFQNWKDYEPELWEEVRAEALAAEQESDAELIGYDLDFEILNKALNNLERLELGEFVELVKKRIELTTPPEPGENAIVVTNPPYGERLAPEDSTVFEFYKTLGDTFKQRFKGYKVYLITSNLTAVKHIHLKASRRIPLFNGKLECRLLEYKMT
ncbi:MAG: class I SAM-dependent RNA methyltransferase [Bacteroidia bacterium]